MDNQQPTARQGLLAREGLASLLFLGGLVLAAAWCPLAPVNLAAEEGGAAAPWVFLGLQELLRHLPPLLGGVVLPGLGLIFLAALPWLAGGQGAALPTWRRRWARVEYGAWLLLAAGLALTLAGWLAG
jgi:quinol-cytochrome oxidoreductase complex cytochrome b subunit